MTVSPNPVQRTALQLYRDSLRLVKHVAPGHSPKSVALRNTVRTEFSKHKDETDPSNIEVYKANAVRALANYMLLQSASKDSRMKRAVQDYHDSNVQDVKDKQRSSDKKDS